MKHDGLRTLLAGCLGVVLIALTGCSENDRPLESPVRLEGSIFGSFYQLTVVDPLTQGQARELETGLVEELERVDQAMSTYRDDSELVIFSRAPLNEWQPLSNELIDVMAISQTVAEASQGAFDVTVGGLVNLWSFGPEARPSKTPDEAVLQQRLEEVGYDALDVDTQNMQARRTRDVFIDLSAVAKGHGTDRAAAYLDNQDIEHYLINIGGELAVRGYRDHQQQTPWRIGIEVPEDGRQQAQHVLPLHEVSVATSGDYRNYFEQDGRRFSHTIDPRTGKPIDHQLASVSVVHPSNAWADAWATALMVLGEKEGMALAQEQKLKVLMLIRDENDWKSVASPAFADHFGAELLDELEIVHGDAEPLGTDNEE
ncbi:FAD:protein FMN transferase [Vreelandella rituensis]|uniref:FAD:protein FMN transferase n=1 Tax=Vreelandella rituensis TaxID=2282306 RepID=A0A368UB86_9GAMM|nr:FAD:protein FMN transferase [Halomonas rituensis]RCV93552.1 FAD:protein FMN transferase [Halomonas rituensis]